MSNTLNKIIDKIQFTVIRGFILFPPLIIYVVFLIIQMICNFKMVRIDWVIGGLFISAIYLIVAATVVILADHQYSNRKYKIHENNSSYPFS